MRAQSLAKTDAVQASLVHGSVGEARAALRVSPDGWGRPRMTYSLFAAINRRSWDARAVESGLGLNDHRCLGATFATCPLPHFPASTAHRRNAPSISSAWPSAPMRAGRRLGTSSSRGIFRRIARAVVRASSPSCHLRFANSSFLTLTGVWQGRCWAGRGSGRIQSRNGSSEN
jgi:hypothetical protein